jgi:hypothetical protein
MLGVKSQGLISPEHEGVLKGVRASTRGINASINFLPGVPSMGTWGSIYRGDHMSLLRCHNCP